MVFRIVFAGGPGCGKSSSLIPARDALLSGGIYCEAVAEAATDLMADGLKKEEVGAYEFQRRIFEQELRSEDEAVKRVEAKGGGAVIFDRGVLDAFTYLDGDDACRLIKEYGFTKEDLLGRYDLALFFHSPAKENGGDLTEGNEYRMEKTPAARRLLTARAEKAWGDHPRIRHIGWESDPEAKLRKVAELLLTELETV